ncbi:MAG: hypothetical protein H8E31_13000 [Planctomycetes bacterium]|nr:hypothetical protein [Planctomycetota bacterium]
MRFAHPVPLLLILTLSACGGGWGTELRQDTPLGAATMFRSDAVDAATAQKAFEAMIAANYNFASDLPEQIDRVDGRLTLRLCNDNQDSIAAIEADGEADGAVRYTHGLARHVSQAVGGEPVDVVLCRLTLDQPFYTVRWKSEEPE